MEQGSEGPEGDGDLFFELAFEVSDGERWKLLRADGWDEFIERMASTVPALAPLRRQALMMLLFVLVEQIIDPSEVRDWLQAHDTLTDSGVEAMVSWLRTLRSERGM